MRLPGARIIVIDDQEKHLDGLVKGLTECNQACWPTHPGIISLRP